MPRSVVFIPTTANIIYTPQQEAISINSLNTITNQGKYLRNIAGTLTYVNLPVPDVATVPSTQNNYVLAFDYANQTFKLVYVPIPYNLLADTNVRYSFLPDSTNTTFTSGSLSLIQNTSTRGSLYNIANITMGNNVVLDTGSKGLKFNGVTLMSLVGAFPSTANCAFVFAVKEAWLGSTQPATLARSMAPGATDTNADLNLQFYYNGSNITTNLTVSNNGVSNSSIPQSGNNLYIVSILCNSGVTYLYVNGILRAQLSRQILFNNDLEQMLFFNGSTNSAFYNTFAWKGTAYAWLSLENATLLSMQKAEGWIKWSSSVNGQPWILDPSHPYATQAPSL